MPKFNIIGGEPDISMSNAYRKDPLHEFTKAYLDTASSILNEDGFDVFEEPAKVMRRKSSRNALKKFFIESIVDPQNPLYDSQDIEDIQEGAELQFENDAKGILEHAAPAEYTPVIGIALPIHKLILMNNVFDKGGIQKVTAPAPKFTISMERRILVKPDGTEIDMFLEQNKMTPAIDETQPEKEIELSLPVGQDLDIVTTEFGGTSLDHLDVSTFICAVKVEGVLIEVGDILPDENGYINRDGVIATENTVTDVWFRTDIRFAPTYNSGMNGFERALQKPLTITYKAEDGTVKEIHPVIIGTMNKDRFNIDDMSHVIKSVRLKAKLDSSNAMQETCHTEWRLDTDYVEIPSAPAINTTISPNEVKDIAALYQVNQLTKHMSMIKTVLSNYKDDKIHQFLDESFQMLDERNSSYDQFDFIAPDNYALTNLEYRQKMFMDFLDHITSKMLQVLNDPNMTFTIYGDPLIVRKITPKDYSYQAPSNIGPVTLDYTQTICNLSDRRVYNFIGSDKLRNTNQLIILINPHNSDRIIYRIYDYMLYVSNEIRNITNPALPAIHAFERYKLIGYQPVQSRIKILNPTGIKSE